MSSNITLDSDGRDWVLVEGTVLKSATTDFMLDSPLRRSRPRGLRRAMVHDGRDGLTINYGRDYPGGVTINDVVELSNRLSGMSILNVSEIAGHAAGLVEGAAGGAGQRGSLVLRGDIRIEAAPHLRAGVAAGYGPSSTEAADRDAPGTVCLQDVIRSLQTQIAVLTERIGHLEDRLAGSSAYGGSPDDGGDFQDER